MRKKSLESLQHRSINNTANSDGFMWSPTNGAICRLLSQNSKSPDFSLCQVGDSNFKMVPELFFFLVSKSPTSFQSPGFCTHCSFLCSLVYHGVVS